MAVKAFSYIRFSTPEQIKGDSLRRQLEKSKEWARQHNVELDDSIRDAMPAFRGENAAKGNLGNFLEAIKAGKIPKGSFLLVESLDRLSRQDVITAFTQFSEILRQGITIVTLADGQVYTWDSVTGNPGHLFASLGIMTRANDESRMKSGRIGASWEMRRKRAANDPLRAITSVRPSWLDFDKNTGKFVLNKERAALIRRMFELRRKGVGKYQIATLLNKEGVPPWNEAKRKVNRGHRPRFWYASYIGRILKNPQVIGTFQPYRMVGGKRTKDGDPISGYFPSAVSEKLFYAVNGAKRLAGGRPSPKQKNLFSGLAFCRCGAPMHHTDKGEYKYLVCSAAKAKAGCRYVSWSYQHFEMAFMAWVTGPDVLTALVESNEVRFGELEAEYESAKGKLDDIHSKLKALVAVAESGKERGKGSEALFDRIIQLEAEKVAAEALRDGKAAELEREREAARTAEQAAASIQELSVALKDLSARFKLRQELGKRIRRIVVYPDKAPVNSEFRNKLIEQIQFWNDVGEGSVSSADEGDQEFPRIPESVVNNPMFQAFLQNGKELTVIPAPPSSERGEVLVPLFATPALDVNAVPADESAEWVS